MGLVETQRCPHLKAHAHAYFSTAVSTKSPSSQRCPRPGFSMSCFLLVSHRINIMAKGRKRPASAIEEDQGSTLTNGAATTSAGESPVLNGTSVRGVFSQEHACRQTRKCQRRPGGGAGSRRHPHPHPLAFVKGGAPLDVRMKGVLLNVVTKSVLVISIESIQYHKAGKTLLAVGVACWLGWPSSRPAGGKGPCSLCPD